MKKGIPAFLCSLVAKVEKICGKSMAAVRSGGESSGKAMCRQHYLQTGSEGHPLRHLWLPADCRALCRRDRGRQQRGGWKLSSAWCADGGAVQRRNTRAKTECPLLSEAVPTQAGSKEQRQLPKEPPLLCVRLSNGFYGTWVARNVLSSANVSSGQSTVPSMSASSSL